MQAGTLQLTDGRAFVTEFAKWLSKCFTRQEGTMLLSIIIPVYNEAESLPTLMARLCPAARGIDWDYELIFVNDGSTDKTGKILEDMADRDRCVKVLTFSRNFGHQAAVTAGLDFAN